MKIQEKKPDFDKTNSWRLEFFAGAWCFSGKNGWGRLLCVVRGLLKLTETTNLPYYTIPI